MKTYAIVNGAAGGGKCQQQATKALDDLGLDLEVAWTTGPGHASRLAADAWRAGHRSFISVGGDGTTYEILNGLFPLALASDDVPKLGCLPLGTGNSFLRDFGITDAAAAAAAIKAQRGRRCDLVRARHADGEIFYINLLSVGFTAGVGALTNDRFKRFGDAGYAVAVVMQVATLEHPVFPMRVDGGDWDRRECAFLSFSNSQFTGGAMRMAPKADPTDGELDIIRVGPVRRRTLLRAFPKIYRGTHVDMDVNEQSKAKNIAFGLTEPVDVMVDGEIRKLQLTELQVLPGVVEVWA